MSVNKVFIFELRYLIPGIFIKLGQDESQIKPYTGISYRKEQISWEVIFWILIF